MRIKFQPILYYRDLHNPGIGISHSIQTWFPVPILKGNGEVIKTIRERLCEPEISDLTVVDFSDLAQGCKTYDEFIEK